MIRAIVTEVVQGIVQRFSAIGRAGEEILDRELFQHYGVTSRPQAGAELIIIRQGGSFIAIASDDRRYRLSLEAGEVALYDHLGQKLHLKADGTIEVTGITKITVTSPEVEIVASTKVTVTSPLLEVTGNITAGGNITATGQVADAAGTKTMSGMRQTFNSHTHPENGTGGGTTSDPVKEM